MVAHGAFAAREQLVLGRTEPWLLRRACWADRAAWMLLLTLLDVFREGSVSNAPHGGYSRAASPYGTGLGHAARSSWARKRKRRISA